MSLAPRNHASASNASSVSPSIQAALALLLQMEDGVPANRQLRDLVITRERWCSLGFCDASFRFLIDMALIECHDDLTRVRDHAPPTLPFPGSVPPATSPYRLTHAGVLWATQVLANRQRTCSPQSATILAPLVNPTSSGVPFWDADNRTLWWGEQIVLTFLRRKHAPALAVVLAAFQDQGWKQEIQNPLWSKTAPPIPSTN